MDEPDMKIAYTINENDLLTYQLFMASRSEKINKKRLISTFLWPSLFILFGILAYFKDHRINGPLLFFAFAILWIVFYPMWEKNHYVKHYLDFVRTTQKDRIGEQDTVAFNEDDLVACNDECESKISYSMIVGIYEIPSLIIIQLKGGQALLLSEFTPGIDQVRLKLQEIANRFDVEYLVDSNWKWK